MKALSTVILKFLSRAARRYLNSYGLLRVKKVFNRSALEWTPSNERLLVLAPHMDDEVIGCGGTLALHVACGADITVVFLTDGRRGGKTETRKQEARLALEELGITKIVFLGGEDGRLGTTKGVGTALRDVLEAARPDIVYLPFFLEEHPDHRAASALLAQAVADTRMSFRCHAYEVWTPLFPNCFVRIDATIEAKRRALGHYQSQLAEADYLHTALGLNAYRSSALLDGRCRFAEAFCSVSLAQYLELFESYGAGVPENAGPSD
ncbi:MAG: PIG-L family deacetylase [Pseudomonadota bacterium]|nr:PIG-L family deacetylase [Pseudomonadota bacterium]